eukprot:CAMPEP_0185035766 /NCGR_PEP_ID=MMETSP1103-20130426/27728_1 /TAXON_ID=36769 /ORGANISM="Paraphysomonas bandaiensis, Strain Caron Lab Isolate" /LENGTH=805 /DNA_ID=CAMNT_0027573011 /DNA_START=118 /DNA_END=2532 /DNA_ORIENTATION=-
MSAPSVFVPHDKFRRAAVMIRKKTGQDVRDGVELLLKSDITVSDQAEDSSGSTDAGELLQQGLHFLANYPFEALDITLGSQTIDVRKAYKKLALKYHPDKNPCTTPLFQAIQCAHEKLTNETSRKAEEARQKAAAAAAAAAASKPPGPPPATKSTTTRSDNSSEAPRKSPSQESSRQECRGHSNTDGTSSRKSTASSNSHHNKGNNNQGCKTNSSSARRETEEEKHARERMEARQREMDAAEARAAERRAKTSYGHRTYSHGPNIHAQKAESKQPHASYKREHSREHGKEKDRKNDRGNERRPKTSRQPISLPVPTGLSASPLDSTIVQLHWNPPSVSDKIDPGILRTELSWRDGPEWEAVAVMISGDRVIKKNLLPGRYYEFRVRHLIPPSTDNTRGSKGPWCDPVSVTLQRETTTCGGDSIPKNKKATSSAPSNSSGTKPLNKQSIFPQTNRPLQRVNSAVAEEVEEDDELFMPSPNGNRCGSNSKSGRRTWQAHGSSARNDTSASLYGKRFGSASSLPEEVLSDDDIIPDEWVESDGEDDYEDSHDSIPRRGFRSQANPQVRKPIQKNKLGSEEKEKGKKKETEEVFEEGETKWYQLIPPDSHVGTGRYVHPVRAASKERSPVVGYISTANKILAKKRLSGWVLVLAHWNTTSPDQASVPNQRGSQEMDATWGWAVRTEWNDRLQRDHVFLRPIPVSVKSIKKPKCAPIPEEAVDGSATNRGTAREDYDFIPTEEANKGSGPSVDVWYEQLDESGYPYYYNSTTGESRWEAPEWVEEFDLISGARYFVQLNKQDATPLKSTW